MFKRKKEGLSTFEYSFLRWTSAMQTYMTFHCKLPQRKDPVYPTDKSKITLVR